MKKMGALEILVILSVLITGGVLGYKLMTQNENTGYEFDGDQMYKCAWVSEKIINKNFPLYAEVKGKWTSSGKDFDGIVLITKARGGTLYGIYNNKLIKLGGEMAHVEDIACKKIILKPVGNTIIKYDINPIECKSFKGLNENIEHSKGQYINSNITILKTYIDGSIGIDCNTFKPSEQQKLKNNINLDLNSNALKIVFIDEGINLIGKIDINDLNSYGEYINSTNMVTSKLTVYLIVNETDVKLSKDIIEKYDPTITKL
ncbi:conserved hypothetical protein [Methanococcus aeolicus Nankai-3]|uniref:Transcription regulator TrmB C-terminal domain-containing protein n=1 Tax=Methanococcus aeolicus (strain ATCC BAA-1280 / DSM 17508 / OCM 812 / Nankai-3) TaxID=419665 RepID=A6UX60_META3|nr:TrmB family transcriptional regulator sugar-binding domain-containing protein [Methanococcus aeolicus]ABR57082.1 conserved hypothetical protein [Methanococcus aeolicus Nankai-3]